MGQPGYPYGPGYPGPYGPPPRRPTNTMAIVALVGSLLFAPLGIVFGHLSLSQIKRTGEEGRGLAIAALAIGYVMVAAVILFLVFALILISMAPRETNPYGPDGSTGISYSAYAAEVTR